MPRINRPLLVAAVLSLALAGAAVAGVVARASSTTKTVRAKVWEYHIALSTRKVPAGKVTLIVKNVGKFTHHIEIAGKGVKKTTPMLAPGKSATLHVTLRAAKYAIWCTQPGHAQLGMKTSLTATSSTTGSTSSGGGTTTSGGGGTWG